MSDSRVVTVNLTRAGDLLQARFFFAGLRKRYPNSELVLVTLPGFRETAQLLPHVDTIVTFDVDALVAPLRSAGGSTSTALVTARDFLADQHLSHASILHNMSHTPQAAMLCAAISARDVYGLLQGRSGLRACRGRWYQYLLSTIRSRSANPFNLVEIFARCSGDDSALQMPAELKFEVCNEHTVRAKLEKHGLVWQQPFIVMIPGASAGNRQWPAGAFATMARALSQNGVRSLIVGGTGDAGLGSEIEKQSGGAAVSLCGMTTFAELHALLRQAKLALGNDTGPLHLAAAVGTPCVGLYIGPADAKDTAPYGVGHHIFQANRVDGPCDYREQCGSCDCKEQIKVSSVLEIALQVLGLAPKASDRASAETVTTHLDSSGYLELRASTSGRFAGQAAQRELWRFILSDIGSASRHVSSQDSKYGDELARFARRVLTQVQTDPTQLRPSLIDTLILELTRANPFVQSFAAYLKLRLDLAPKHPLYYLAALNETLSILIRAARAEVETVQPQGQPIVARASA